MTGLQAKPAGLPAWALAALVALGAWMAAPSTAEAGVRVGVGVYFGTGYYRPRYYRPRYRVVRPYRYYRPRYRVRRVIRPRRVYRKRRVYRGGFSSAHYGYCSSRYRSYRVSDNTFQPYHGRRRQCRSPY